MFWGFISQVQALNVRVPYVGFKPFASQGEAWGFEFSPDWVAMLGVSFTVRWHLRLSYLLQWISFSFAQ